jgi:hypothetical protein
MGNIDDRAGTDHGDPAPMSGRYVDAYGVGDSGQSIDHAGTL